MILDKFRLDGKVALVTGASRGLGQGIAVGLAEAGADVAGVARSDCDETRTQIEALGHRFVHLSCDLGAASVSELQAVVERTIAELGGLHILANVAGATARHATVDHPEDEWDQVMQINLKSLMFLSQAAARHFERQGGGKIINIASVLSFQGGIRCAAYTASKHGVAGLTRIMANELAGKNINVNAIAPGYMLTDLTQLLHDDPVRGPAIMERLPVGRWGTPEDLKGPAVFLASEASAYCHGHILVVDGSWMNR
jgi:2-deoxy-D-gluconate 3-dehydrogenase